MTTYHLCGEFVGVPTAGLDELTNQLMEALLDLEEPGHIIDTAMSAELARGTLEIELNITASDQADAVRCFMTTIRAALHAIGIGTPGWENAIEDMAIQVRKQDMPHLIAA